MFETVPEPQPDNIEVHHFEEIKSETQPFVPKNNIKRFQMIADFDNRMLEMYKAGVEQIKGLQFENQSLEALKQKYTSGQYENVIEFLNKLQSFSSNKYEAVKQALS